MKKSSSRPASLAGASGSALVYRMHIATLKGQIWHDDESLDLTQRDGLLDAFAVGAAKCQGITKRSGFATRLIFVCEPNDSDDPRTKK